MRIAVVSDMHGNLVALEAVLADLEQVRPDLVVHGGDLALGGPQPVEVVDRIRALGWPGVIGNTDAVLSGEAAQIDHVRGSFVEQAAARTREMLGAERLAWLLGQPLRWSEQRLALVHATPDDCWTVIPHDADAQTLEAAFAPLGKPVAVYGHIHHPFVRKLDGLTVVNSGSVSLALDGDVRAKYAVIEEGRIEHRRLAYDIEGVAAQMLRLEYPNGEGYARWLRSGRNR